MGELGSGGMGGRIHLPGVLFWYFFGHSKTGSTTLKTSQLSWQNPEPQSISCSFHSGLAGFHQCKSKTSHWLPCWIKWVHFYIVSAQWSCLTWFEEHCQDADVNREKSFLKLPLLCSGRSSICSTQTTWMVWLQLNSSFFKISWFPKHLFFFPCPQDMLVHCSKMKFHFLYGRTRCLSLGFTHQGFLTLVASPFQAVQWLSNIILLAPGFLKWNTTEYHQLLSDWEETPCLRWKNHLLNGRRQQNNVSYYIEASLLISCSPQVGILVIRIQKPDCFQLLCFNSLIN